MFVFTEPNINQNICCTNAFHQILCNGKHLNDKRVMQKVFAHNLSAFPIILRSIYSDECQLKELVFSQKYTR